jgi:hypothetical protein
MAEGGRRVECAPDLARIAYKDGRVNKGLIVCH